MLEPIITGEIIHRLHRDDRNQNSIIGYLWNVSLVSKCRLEITLNKDVSRCAMREGERERERATRECKTETNVWKAALALLSIVWSLAKYLLYSPAFYTRTYARIETYMGFNGGRLAVGKEGTHIRSRVHTLLSVPNLAKETEKYKSIKTLIPFLKVKSRRIKYR